MSYHSLTPSSSADPDGEYSRALSEALKNEKINNVAVTGKYGSGKSSVLRTFELNNKDKWNFFNVSLATFKDEEKGGASQEDKLLSIERSILQQFFYSVKQSQIPMSRFKRISTPDRNRIGVGVVFFIMWAFSFLYLVYPSASLFSAFSNISYLYYWAVIVFLVFFINLLIKIASTSGRNISSLCSTGFANALSKTKPSLGI